MRHSVDERLQVYGQRPQWMHAYCPICDTLKETVFFNVEGEMVCRQHPGHPLFEEGPERERATNPNAPAPQRGE